MKLSSFLLSASLAANAAMLVAVFAGRNASTSTDPAVPSSPFNYALSADNAAPFGKNPDAATSATPGTSTQSGRPAGTLWTILYTDDLDELLRRLRAAGVPYKAASQLVVDLSEEKAERARAALQGRSDSTPYWKNVPYFPDDPLLKARVREVNAERADTLRKLFFSAEAIGEDEEQAFFARQRYGNLSVDKLQQLARIALDYDRLRADVRLRSPQDMSADDRARIDFLTDEQRKDIQEALTPEEFAQYEIRSSPTAGALRTQLNAFEPSEAEFKALYALHRAADVQLGNIAALDPKNSQARAAALKALEPQIQTALGPERYADYLQAGTPGAGQLNRLLGRLELPLRTATRIESVRTDITQRAKTLQADTSLTAAERQARLAALAREAQSILTTTLGGSRGFDAYTEIKGDWLRALQPKPPPVP